MPQLCLGIETFLEGWDDSIVMNQCENQDGWLVVQVNDPESWQAYMAGVAAGTFPAGGIYELPPSAFSSALYFTGLAGSEFSTYIFSLRNRCEWVFEYSERSIREAVQAFAVSKTEWASSTAVAASEVTATRLTIEGC